jgi:two-component system nitrate/nitrite response regulator NarL
MALAHVLIEDNQPVFRHGLVALLSSRHSDWDIRAPDHPSDCREMLETQSVDLLIIGAELLCKDFASQYVTNSRPKIIAITEEYGCALSALGCMALGANATISRCMASTTLLSTVDSLIFLDEQGYTDALQSDFDSSCPAPASQGVTIFSPRQLDVLRLLGEGQSNKRIARGLGLSPSTVKVHLGAVFRALGARNRLEAAVLASASSALVVASAR